MKTKTPIKIMFFVLLPLVILACENSSWTCLRGNGIIDSDIRDLNYYNGVVTEGEFEIFYIPDTSYFVELRTDQNLLPYIRTRISGSTLIVDNGTRKCLRSEYPIGVYVHTPEIQLMSLVGSGLISADYVYSDELRLEISGSGYIDILEMDVLDLRILITGSGDVDLRGTTNMAEYTITGSGTISAQNLLSNTCIAEISGSGTIYCHADKFLEAIISGSGSIFYRGAPTVSSHISGDGFVQGID
ncbi:head GIN domain-containing protein [Bacteroidota bacterium]